MSLKPVAPQIDYKFALSAVEIEKQINDGEWKILDVRSGPEPTLPDGSYLDRSAMGNVTKYRLKLIHADGRTILTGKLQGIETAFEISGLPLLHPAD